MHTPLALAPGAMPPTPPSNSANNGLSRPDSCAFSVADTPASRLARSWQQSHSTSAGATSSHTTSSVASPFANAAHASRPDRPMPGKSTGPSTPSLASGSSGAPGGDYFAPALRSGSNGPSRSAARQRDPSILAPAGDSAASELQTNPWSALLASAGPQTSRKGIDAPEWGQVSSVNHAREHVDSMPSSSASIHGKRDTANLMSGPVSGGNFRISPPQARRRNSGATTSTTSTTPSVSSTGSVGDADLGRFRALPAAELVERLALEHAGHPQTSQGRAGSADNTLIIDIRPSTSFALARIRGSINVCAPSTLLRRPAVTVQRLEEELLSSEEDVRRFARWRTGPLRDPAAPADQASSSMQVATARDGASSQGDGITSIVVLDSDSSGIKEAGKPASGGGGACLAGILRKFDAAGFAGELCWLVGGFQHFSELCERTTPHLAQGLIDRGEVALVQSPHDPSSNAPGDASPHLQHLSASAALATRRGSAPVIVGPPGDHSSLKRFSLVRPAGLPQEAFSLKSTAVGRRPHTAGPSEAKTALFQGFSLANAVSSQVNGGEHADAGKTDLSPAACANPFFDNVRQNRELQHGITERVPMELPPMSHAQVTSLPVFLRRLVEKDAEQRASVLAQAFFDIEKAEQERLMNTMQKHSMQSCMDPRVRDEIPLSASNRVEASSSKADANHASDETQSFENSSFPFSISAALERGSENRYNNIWTFEHSRVRIQRPQDLSNPIDYINGSFIEPARDFGSRRKYISTQAPLPTTFESFWTMVWEQDCHVIVMLTREFESGRIQSHDYWTNPHLGKSNLRVTLDSEESLDDEGRPIPDSTVQATVASVPVPVPHSRPQAASFFDASGPAASEDAAVPCIIRRHLTLRSVKPDSTTGRLPPPRRVIQLQYVAWPDYSIPDSPSSLLNFMDMAAAAQHEADSEAQGRESSSSRAVTSLDGANAHQLPDAHVGPMVVHCSAGVGRTGCYVVIDSVLDALRRHRRRVRGQQDPLVWDNGTHAVFRGRLPRHFQLSMPAHVMRDASTVLSSSGGSSSSGSGSGIHALVEARKARKNLKRELSPSAMDDESTSEPGNDVLSNGPGSDAPPLRRNRSDDVDDASSTAGGASTPGRSSISSFSDVGSGHGVVETPSRAMGSLRIVSSASGDGASVSSTTSSPRPQPASVPVPMQLQHQQASNMQSVTTPVGLNTSGALSTSDHVGSPSELLGNPNTGEEKIASPPFMLSPPAQSVHATKPASTFRAASAAVGIPARGDDPDVDLVRRAVEVTREQRMSSVQTNRQYVFVYSAVLAGVLRELRREGILSPGG